MSVPNVFLRPPNQRKEADASKALLSVPEGDHLTLMNVYNSFVNSKHFSSKLSFNLMVGLDKGDSQWAWNNYLSARALTQADNVRSQLLRTMERQDLDLTTRNVDGPQFYDNIRKTLVCGFFMQVAHKEGERGGYKTVKDNQVRAYSVRMYAK